MMYLQWQTLLLKLIIVEAWIWCQTKQRIITFLHQAFLIRNLWNPIDMKKKM